MTGCTESGLALLHRELDETIESLLPSVEALLQALASDESVTSEPSDAGHTSSIPLRFPDAIGAGKVVGVLFRYRDHVRLDIEIVHNRRFARPGGQPSDRRCFLNDFVASISLPAKTAELPQEFRRYVVSGVSAARDAVQRHNRQQTAPWSQVVVAAG